MRELWVNLFSRSRLFVSQAFFWRGSAKMKGIWRESSSNKPTLAEKEYGAFHCLIVHTLYLLLGRRKSTHYEECGCTLLTPQKREDGCSLSLSLSSRYNQPLIRVSSRVGAETFVLPPPWPCFEHLDVHFVLSHVLLPHPNCPINWTAPYGMVHTERSHSDQPL